jgi:hypothetical protein
MQGIHTLQKKFGDKAELVRQVRSELRSELSSQYGTPGFVRSLRAAIFRKSALHGLTDDVVEYLDCSLNAANGCKVGAQKRMRSNGQLALIPVQPVPNIETKVVTQIVYIPPAPTLNEKKFWALYNNYLKSPEWARYRVRIFNQRGRRCEDCGISNVPLQLHHICYDRVGEERPEDVIINCIACHQRKHPNKRIG